MRYLPTINRDDYPALPCEMDPERWFADTATSVGARLVASAIDACTKCPVLAACQQYTDKVRPDVGVWAGRYYTSPTRNHKKMAVTHG